MAEMAEGTSENGQADVACTDSSGRDPALLEKITKSLNIKIPPHILRSKDPRALLTTVFSSWLPLSTALLVSVIEHLPSPPVAQAARLPALIEASPGAEHVDATISKAMTEFQKADGNPVVAYVSKMVAIPESELPSNKRRGGALTAEEARELGRKKRAEIARAQALANGGEGENVSSVTDALSSVAIGEENANDVPTNGDSDKPEDPEHLIGFARVYSGTLKVGGEVYVLPPRFTPASPHAAPQPKKVTITALYLLMGRSLEPLESAPAGTVVGIAGLEGAILKSGTLCSRLDGAPNLSSTSAISTNAPIVRVALEPAWPGDLDKMIRGLRMLEQADPAVIYEQLESGEHVILTAGELHLERCLKDLQERFAKCEIQAGEVIVPYREGIVKAEEMNPPRDAEMGRGRVEAITASKQVAIRLQIRPLPQPVTEFLTNNGTALKRIYAEKKAQEEGRSKLGEGDDQQTEHENDHSVVDDAGTTQAGSLLSMADFTEQLTKIFAGLTEDRDVWKGMVERITAFGPRRSGPNLLIDTTKENICSKL